MTRAFAGLLLLACWACNFDEAMVLRYRAPQGAIQRLSMPDDASFQDIHSRLRELGAINQTSMLRVEGRNNEVIMDDSTLCRDRLAADDLLLISQQTGSSQWTRRSTSTSRASAMINHASNASGSLLIVPSEAFQLLRAIATGDNSVGLLVGAGRTPDGKRLCDMLIRLPFVSPRAPVGAKDIATLLHSLSKAQLLCQAGGMSVLGIAVAEKKGLISPRSVYMSLLVREYLSIDEDVVIISVSSAADGQRLTPRKLASAREAGAPAEPSYSVEAHALTAAVRKAADGGAFPSFFTAPNRFIRRINTGGVVIEADKPVGISGADMTKIDPLLILEAVGISMGSSGVSHSFPHSGSSDQRHAMRRVAAKLEGRANATSLRALLRDPQLLLYMRDQFYPSDTASFLSLCKFVFARYPSATGFGPVDDSAFLVSVDYLRDLIKDQRSEYDTR